MNSARCKRVGRIIRQAMQSHDKRRDKGKYKINISTLSLLPFHSLDHEVSRSDGLLDGENSHVNKNEMHM